MADGKVVFEITADGKQAVSTIKDITNTIEKETKQWDRSSDKATDGIEKSIKEVTGTVQKEAKQWENAADKAADGMQNSFSGMAKKVVAGLSAAGVAKALFDWGKAAVDAASDLAEVQNVVDVTFGDSTARIESWSKSAGKQFGLTETQAKRFTSTLGAMFKSSGINGDEIVQMSTDLAGLAADMASFYNLDFETAFQKIRSGISGETEPLKQLGINMSVANLEAFALEKGITKAFSAMSQGEQTQLRYQYLMQATADAQGDFSRTSDGFANATRKLQTNIDTITTALGSTFLGVVEGAVNGLNGFFELLIPDQSKRTVLDDFADINLNTDEKIKEIRRTATEADALADQLDKLAFGNIDGASQKIQKLAQDLNSIEFDGTKAGALNSFLSALSENVEIVSAIQGTDVEGATEWINGIKEAASGLEESDVQGWTTLLNSIKEGLPGIENTEFGENFFNALSDGFQSVGQQTSVLEWAMDALGDKTERTTEEQQLWLEICRRLVQTIPGLSSIINTQTGEIQGGTQAVHDYIEAWEQGQTKLALLGALEQKKSAIEERFSDLPGLELDMLVAERRVRQNREAIDALRRKYGLTTENIDYSATLDTNMASGFGVSNEDWKAYNQLAQAESDLEVKAQEATEAFNTQKAALEEATVAVEEARQTVEEMPGTYEEAADASEEWSDAQKQAAREAEEALETALANLNDYVSGVRSATATAVDSVVKGFTGVKRPDQVIADQIAALTEEQKQYEANTKEYQKYTEQIQKLQESMQPYTVAGMQSSLDSQMAFMEDYITNLQTLQEAGLSNEFLASLSDGSAESAAYLAQLVEQLEMADGSVAELDEQFQAIQAKKQEFVDVLTEQKLTADQTYDEMTQVVAAAYQSMAEAASEGVDGMNVSGEIEAAMSENVIAMAEAISSHTGEVASAVDGIIAQLDRLNSFGVHIGIGSAGSIDFTLSLDGSHETGLDNVPFDHYLAELHAGEGILTAEENRVWQRFKNGSASSRNVDYDALGGVMRDNIQPGGNVYLDGRVVGAVISQQQGQSYRALQRSGWQG